MLVSKNVKMMEEIKTLSKVIHSTRQHFKEIEKADFAALQQQIADYESKVAELDVDETQILEFRTKRAKK